MRILYILSESDYDAGFYRLCAERISGHDFEDDHVVAYKISEIGGKAAVKQWIHLALKTAKSLAGGAQAFFIGAIDNDRTPHPENKERINRRKLFPEELREPSRLEWLEKAASRALGPNRNAWPVHVALAVPVEMIESWILLVLDPEIHLPIFAKANSASAKKYYGKQNPLPQLKNLRDDWHKKLAMPSPDDFLTHVALEMDPEDLASRSQSFCLFMEWLDRWPKPEA